MTNLLPYSKAARVLLLYMLMYQTDVFAVALSDIRLNSFINQPVNATIELLSASPAELDNLNVYLSKTRKGESGRVISTQLKVELVRPEKGNSYLMITTKDNMREPVLNFLVELSWPSGRIQREYTLLLNLPH